MNNNKLGQEQAFPIEQHDGVGKLYEVHHGMSKRFYAANNYAKVADAYFSESKAKEILSFLDLPEGTVYNPIKHYPKAIVKMQYLLADELLRQEQL